MKGSSIRQTIPAMLLFIMSIRYAAIIDKFFSWMYFQGYNYWSAADEGLAQRMAGRSSHAVYQPFAPE